jgi:hypothetical protein
MNSESSAIDDDPVSVIKRKPVMLVLVSFHTPVKTRENEPACVGVLADCRPPTLVKDLTRPFVASYKTLPKVNPALLGAAITECVKDAVELPSVVRLDT